jgi:hypothetical protein
MAKFFCAEASRQAEEDIIGTATPYATYVLVECPTPWAFEAFDSPAIPQNLRDLVEAVRCAKLPIRFLLITQRQRKSHQTKLLIYTLPGHRLCFFKRGAGGEPLAGGNAPTPPLNQDLWDGAVYQQESQKFAGGYIRSEWNLDGLEQVADVVKGYLVGTRTSEVEQPQDLRDILICTHGIHDQCCARYGLPFYRQALATVSALNLNHVRIWKASHFGGHRFAPTAIDFPNGRYYGILDDPSLQTILTRTGDIYSLHRVYRGWGILPAPLQVLERKLMLDYGWDWFSYKIMHTILEQRENNDWIRAELAFELPDGTIYTYRAELIQDDCKTLCLKGSCSATKAATFVKYAVDKLDLHSVKPIYLSA